MHIISRRHVGRAAIGTALVSLLAVLAMAQTAGGPDPMTFDVAGVRLGMTPNDAIAALKRFDGGYTISKRYYAQPQFTYGNDESKELKDIESSDRRFAYFNNLSVVKSEMRKKCDYVGTGNGRFNCYPEAHVIETVMVWFSPVPGQERVIAVQRKVPFEKQPLPAIVSLKNGIFAKYPKDQATFERQDASGYTVDWAFDGQRRIMSASKRTSRYSTDGRLPRNANPGDGIVLSVNFESNNQNAGLADNMSITLYDGSGLFRSIGQSQAAYKMLKDRTDAEDVRRSQGQNQPKL